MIITPFSFHLIDFLATLYHLLWTFFCHKNQRVRPVCCYSLIARNGSPHHHQEQQAVFSDLGTVFGIWSINPLVYFVRAHFLNKNYVQPSFSNSSSRTRKPHLLLQRKLYDSILTPSWIVSKQSFELQNNEAWQLIDVNFKLKRFFVIHKEAQHWMSFAMQK